MIASSRPGKQLVPRSSRTDKSDRIVPPEREQRVGKREEGPASRWEVGGQRRRIVNLTLTTIFLSQQISHRVCSETQTHSAGIQTRSIRAAHCVGRPLRSLEGKLDISFPLSCGLVPADRNPHRHMDQHVPVSSYALSVQSFPLPLIPLILLQSSAAWD